MQLSTEDLDAAEQEYSRIYEEVTLLKSLNHKNIVKYVNKLNGKHKMVIKWPRSIVRLKTTRVKTISFEELSVIF